MKSAKTTLILLTLILSTFVSCKKDDPVQPELPPIETFEMNYSSLGSEKSAMSYGNWLYSVDIITTFSTISATYMVVPIAAYKKALTQQPTYMGNNVWEWSYDFPVIGATYTATLTATGSTKNEIHWEMHITGTGLIAFSNFLWVEGTTTNNSATWTIYESPTSTKAGMEVTSKFDEKGTLTSLKYSVIKNTAPSYQSYIEFGTQSGQTFDRYYNVYLANKQSTIKIECSSTDRLGRVNSLNYFNDNLWHCWNSFYIDEACD